jgi:hypothetical protein
LIEALPYKPEGRVFDSRWYHPNFSSGRNMALEVDSASNSTEYQQYFLMVKTAGG